MNDDRCKCGQTIQILSNVIKVSLPITTDNLTYNKFQYFLRLLRPENFMTILRVCQTKMPIIYILIIMMSQRDIINETTVSDL